MSLQRLGTSTVGITLEHSEGEIMTTLDNRPNTALIVIDVQNGVVVGNHERDAVVASLVGKFPLLRRRAGDDQRGGVLDQDELPHGHHDCERSFLT